MPPVEANVWLLLVFGPRILLAGGPEGCGPYGLLS